MPYKQTIPKAKDIKLVMQNLDDSYTRLEWKSQKLYGSSYRNLVKKEREEIAFLVAKDVA